MNGGQHFAGMTARYNVSPWALPCPPALRSLSLSQ